MASNDHGKQAFARVEIPDTKLISKIDGDEVVSTELKNCKGCGSRRLNDFVNSTLAKDVDLSMTELCLARSDGE